MNPAIAFEYIPGRMKALGYGNKYYLKFRHLLVESAYPIEIAAYNQLYILIHEPPDVRVDSDSGVFDTKVSNIDEMTYEHQGLIKISTDSVTVKAVKFIQVIPIQKEEDANTI